MDSSTKLIIEIIAEAKNVKKVLDGVLGQTESFSSKAKGFLSNALSFAAGGLLERGLTKVTGGFFEAAKAGLGFNDAMEQTTARINAFTKDGQVTADLLDLITERAAKTPFAFQDMADATAALLPAAKQSEVGIEDLIAKAEILAASNPAQGLTGAAFSLKEALGGDFTSAIERFNLSRGFINQLKEEGVPALEIVSQAMQQMGLDADLVGGLAETATGRWSTFKDTIVGLEATITQPIFDKFSEGLGKVNQFLVDNEPAIRGFVDNVAELTSEFLERAEPIVLNFFNKLQEVGPPALEIIRDSLSRMAEVMGLVTEDTTGMDAALKLLEKTLDLIVTGIEAVAVVSSKLADAFELARDLNNELKDVTGGFDLGAGIGSALNPIGSGVGGISDLGGLLGFASGGTVPGAIGEPQLVVAHGGETITPPGQSPGGTTVGDISITIPGAGDPQAVAMAVQRALQNLFNGAQPGAVSG